MNIFIKKYLTLFIISAFCIFYAEPLHALSYKAYKTISSAEKLIKNNKPLNALKLLEEFDFKNKEHKIYQVYFLLGNSYFNYSKSCNESLIKPYLNKAQTSYKKVLKINPDYLPCLLNLAKTYYELGKMDRAGEAFVSAYDLSKVKNGEYLYFAFVSFFHAHKNIKAIDIFERLKKDHPEDIKNEWRESFISILISEKREINAVSEIKVLLDKICGDKRKKWQGILLYQYLNLKLNDQALNYCISLTKEDPVEKKWWKSLSKIYLMKDRPEKAIESMIVYSYLTDLSDDEKSIMADLFLFVSIPSKASFYYEEVLKDNFSVVMIRKIVQAYIMSHEPEKALKWINIGLGKYEDKELTQQKDYVLYLLRGYL